MTVSRADSSKNKNTVANKIESAWYRSATWLYCLWPLSLIYAVISRFRRFLYWAGFLHSYRAPIPVIIVGNISVGGTGKTPFVIALVKQLQQAGFQPGIVSRGYGSRAASYPFHVSRDGNPSECGDEPLLMAIRTGVPVVIDANRSHASRQLVEQHSCDVIVSDDGLQHYALQRDIELVVVDGQRGFGNAKLLPMGPLRESISRLKQVDFIISNGAQLPQRSSADQYLMQLQPLPLEKLTGGQSCAVKDWPDSKRVHGVAGIGNPSRFFHSLRQLGFDPVEHRFDDHHDYCEADLQFTEDLAIIMTEKDAVKAQLIKAPVNSWYLPVAAEIDSACFQKIIQQLHGLAD